MTTPHRLFKTQEDYDNWVRMKLKEARRDDPALVYYYAHKDEIKKKRDVKVKCECSGKWCIGHKARHLKSLKHQNWMKENNLQQEETIRRNPRRLKIHIGGQG